MIRCACRLLAYHGYRKHNYRRQSVISNHYLGQSQDNLGMFLVIRPDYSGRQAKCFIPIMDDSPNFNAEDFLASPAELVGLIARFADSSRKRSTQHRLDRELAREALAALLATMALTKPAMSPPFAELPASPPVADDAMAPAKAAAPAVVTRIHRRQYCQCGKCKWCLDNVRWARVFEEKFADPAYYGPIRVRHNSSLAGGF